VLSRRISAWLSSRFQFAAPVVIDTALKSGDVCPSSTPSGELLVTTPLKALSLKRLNL